MEPAVNYVWVVPQASGCVWMRVCEVGSTGGASPCICPPGEVLLLLYLLLLMVRAVGWELLM
jgi:hypothetical protein